MDILGKDSSGHLRYDFPNTCEFPPTELAYGRNAKPKLLSSYVNHKVVLDQFNSKQGLCWGARQEVSFLSVEDICPYSLLGAFV